MKYLIWSIEHGMWWMPNEHGYTKKRSDAGRYEREQAELICLRANEHSGSEPNEAMVPDAQPL